MREYALVLLDNDPDNRFSVLCQSKFSFFNKKPGKKSYVDLITGAEINPRSSKKEGLTYSMYPKTINVEKAAQLLMLIRSIGPAAYASHIMEVQNRTLSPVQKQESLYFGK